VTLDLIPSGTQWVCLWIMKKKYPVILTEAEREQLKSLIAAGTAPARKLTHEQDPAQSRPEPGGAWLGG
jgi:hypothetical protein